MEALAVSSDKLQNAIAGLIEKTTTTLGDGVSFLSTQLPDVIRQLLYWKATESLASCITGIILLCTFIFIDYKIFKLIKKSLEQEDLIWGWGLFGTFFRAIYFVPLGMINFKWLQIWIAPKVFLIEYAHTFLTK